MRKYLNNYSTTLTAALTDIATTCSVTTVPPSLSSGEYYILTLVDSLTAPTKTEIIKVTGITGTDLTIERGLEGTTALAFDSGNFVELRETAKAFSELDNPELITYRERVHAATASINADNGPIQTLTVAANTTISVVCDAGQSLTLHLTGGGSYVITWPTMTWVNGVPTLGANDVITFWKIGSVLYGAHVGDY